MRVVVCLSPDTLTHTHTDIGSATVEMVSGPRLISLSALVCMCVCLCVVLRVCDCEYDGDCVCVSSPAWRPPSNSIRIRHTAHLPLPCAFIPFTHTHTLAVQQSKSQSADCVSFFYFRGQLGASINNLRKL